MIKFRFSYSRCCILRENYLYTEFFWSVFPRIQTEYAPEKRTLFKNRDRKTNTDTFHAVAEFMKLKRLAYKNYLTWELSVYKLSPAFFRSLSIMNFLIGWSSSLEWLFVGWKESSLWCCLLLICLSTSDAWSLIYGITTTSSF